VEALLHLDELLELALHQLRHRDAGPRRDDLGDVVGRDLLAQQRAGPWSAASCLLLLEPLLERRERLVLELRGGLVVGLALGLLDPHLEPSSSVLVARIAAIAVFSASQRCLSARFSSSRSASSFSSAARRAFDASSVSLRSASRSISSWIRRRSASSSSTGIESISIRSREAASSTRSIALSGRKRSLM
jgi:hypothetical protein